MRKLLIFPFNGNGIEALSCLHPEDQFLGFIDDTPSKQGMSPFGFQVFPRTKMADYPDACVLAVPGNAANYTGRDELISGLGLPGSSFTSLISPKAYVSPLARIGRNVLIMPGVVITSNAVIGDHVVVLPNTIIHHDVQIDDYTMIGSGVCIAGYTRVGRKCYIGSGSNLINNIVIGEGTLAGLGANIIRSTRPGSRIVGNPGRAI